MKLLLTGFFQIFFVCINTYLIAHKLYIHVLFCSFIISFIWSFNIKQIVFGKTIDRIIYSTGAALGGISGLYISTFLTTV